MKKIDTTEIAVKAQLLKQDNKQAIDIGMFFSYAIIGAVLVSNPAEAATLKGTAVELYNVIFGPVGVLGAIAFIVAGFNWAFGNFLNRDDPKKFFIQVCIGLVIAFGAITIVTWIKDFVGTGSAIGSL